MLKVFKNPIKAWKRRIYAEGYKNGSRAGYEAGLVDGRFAANRERAARSKEGR